MSKWQKFGFVFGLYLAVIFKFAIYAVCAGGFVYQVINLEFPWMPIILFFLFSVWKRLIILESYFVNFVSKPPKATLDHKEVDALINLAIFRNTYHGGPN